MLCRYFHCGSTDSTCFFAFIKNAENMFFVEAQIGRLKPDGLRYNERLVIPRSRGAVKKLPSIINAAFLTSFFDG